MTPLNQQRLDPKAPAWTGPKAPSVWKREHPESPSVLYVAKWGAGNPLQYHLPYSHRNHFCTEEMFIWEIETQLL